MGQGPALCCRHLAALLLPQRARWVWVGAARLCALGRQCCRGRRWPALTTVLP